MLKAMMVLAVALLCAGVVALFVGLTRMSNVERQAAAECSDGVSPEQMAACSLACTPRMVEQVTAKFCKCEIPPR